MIFLDDKETLLNAALRVRTYYQKLTAAARAIAERKTVVDLS